MAVCDCSLKHANGGVCNCLDNNPLPDWDNFEEDWADGDVEIEKEEFKIDKITKKDDDWFAH